MLLDIQDYQGLADAPPFSSAKHILSMRRSPTEAGKEGGGPWLAGAGKMAAAAANGSGGSSGMEVDAAGNGLCGATSGIALAEYLEYYLSPGEATDSCPSVTCGQGWTARLRRSPTPMSRRECEGPSFHRCVFLYLSQPPA